MNKSRSLNLNKKIKIYELYKYISFTFLKQRSLFILKGLFGFFFFKLPSLYFVKNLEKNISFIFLTKYLYKSFLKSVISHYNYSRWMYCIKFKMRGLGFKLIKVTDKLYYFFFNQTNMQYLHIPTDIIIRKRRKRIILLSFNFEKLKLLFSYILIFKKLGPYRLRGIRYPRQIILLKKKKKI